MVEYVQPTRSESEPHFGSEPGMVLNLLVWDPYRNLMATTERAGSVFTRQ